MADIEAENQQLTAENAWLTKALARVEVECREARLYTELEEQREVFIQLKAYVEELLSLIVQTNPEMLERK